MYSKKMKKVVIFNCKGVMIMQVKIDISEEKYNLLLQYAKESGISLQELIAGCLDEVLEDYEDLKCAMERLETLDYDNLKDFSELAADIGINPNEI